MTDTIDIPEFKGSEGSKAPKNNFTPINPKSGDTSSGGFLAKLPLGKNAIIGLAMFLVLGISGLGYLVYSGSQETQSEAAGTVCRYKPVGKNCNVAVDVPGCPADPGGVLVQCSDDSYWCALPNQTFEVCGDYCKKVNTCTLKCRKPGEVENSQTAMLQNQLCPMQRLLKQYFLYSS